jgi:hypothetical protein
MEKRTYGKQVVTFEEDVVHLRWVGEFTGEEISGVLDDLYRLAETRTVFFLVDMAEGKGVSYEARRALLKYNDRKPYGGTVLYNASFTTKVLANLMANATNLLRRREVRQEMVFVKDEAEARAWLQRRREELAPG